jgi:hypothetical protein
MTDYAELIQRRFDTLGAVLTDEHEWTCGCRNFGDDGTCNLAATYAAIVLAREDCLAALAAETERADKADSLSSVNDWQLAEWGRRAETAESQVAALREAQIMLVDATRLLIHSVDTENFNRSERGLGMSSGLRAALRDAGEAIGDALARTAGETP